jgi:hypothetical protein
VDGTYEIHVRSRAPGERGTYELMLTRR